MNAPNNRLCPICARQPGQLALAEGESAGGDRQRWVSASSQVPAKQLQACPDHFAREKAALFDRLPQVIAPSALLPDPAGVARMMRRADRCRSPVDNAGKAQGLPECTAATAAPGWSRQRCAMRQAARHVHIMPGPIGLDGGLMALPRPETLPPPRQGRNMALWNCRPAKPEG